MDKNSIIAKIKQKTKGIYSEKFYFDLADDILGVKKYNYPEYARKYDLWIEGVLNDGDVKYYTDTLTRIFNEDNNTKITPKKVVMIFREYCEHLGYTLTRGKDVNGRYVTIIKWEVR